MIRSVVICDSCGKVIDDSPDGGSMDGFTETTLKRHTGGWPDDLYHLCKYCVFRAKVVYLKKKEDR